jgi:hypothetical protein
VQRIASCSIHRDLLGGEHSAADPLSFSRMAYAKVKGREGTKPMEKIFALFALASAFVSERVITSSFETDLEPVRQKTERLRQLRLAKEVAEPVPRARQKVLRSAAHLMQDQKKVELRVRPKGIATAVAVQTCA